MSKEKATSLEKKAALEAIRLEFTGNDCPTQRMRILAAIERLGTINTEEARRYLDIYYPPARVNELRAQGHPIKTVMISAETQAGVIHRIGQYLKEIGGQDGTA